MADNPSLSDLLPDALASAYAGAILAATRETGFDRTTFTSPCTWSFEQVMDDDFWLGDTLAESRL